MTLRHEIEQRLQLMPDNSVARQLPSDYIWPAYRQHLTIANLAGTVAALLGKKVPGEPPLPEELWRPFGEDVRRVILLTIDALGYQQLNRQLADFPNSPWHEIIGRGIYVPLTSVAPSTTSAALTSINCGYTPGQHGIVGFRLLLRHYGTVVDTIFWRPSGEKRNGTLQTVWGIDPTTFLMTPTAVQNFETAGIRTRVHIWYPFAQSPLSQIHYRGTSQDVMGAVTMADLAVQLRQGMRQPAQSPTYISAYWHTIDGSAHVYGPNQESWQAELEAIGHTLLTELLHKVSDPDTLLIITADHGQIGVPPEFVVKLDDHPVLADMLLLPPTGDSRTTYLHLRQGLVEEAIAYINGKLGDCFVAVPTADALSARLFGRDVSVETQTRLGDVVIFALKQCTFVKQPKKMLGWHGGLSPAEMLVPYIAFRL